MKTNLSAPMSRRKVHWLLALLTVLHDANSDTEERMNFLTVFYRETPEEYEFGNGVYLRRIGKDRFRIEGIRGDGGVIFYPRREIRRSYGY